MKIKFCKLEDDNRRLSKVIENVLNDPKNNLNNNGSKSDFVGNNEVKEENKDFSSTFNAKNKENMLNIESSRNIDEKNETSERFNNIGNKSSSLPALNIESLIKLKEVNNSFYNL